MKRPSKPLLLSALKLLAHDAPGMMMMMMMVMMMMMMMTDDDGDGDDDDDDDDDDVHGEERGREVSIATRAITRMVG